MNSYNNLRLRANISKGREDRLGPPKSMGRGPARSSLPKFLSVIAIAAAIALPQYAHDIAPGPPQTQPILLTNADIHTVSGESVLGGSLLFENGLITKIASRIDAPANTQVIDLQGKQVYPGLISANSTIGLVEINAVRATRDYQETGKTNANARSYTAINPDTEIIPVTRANGVLTAHVLPQPGGKLFGGTSAIVNLDGWTIEEMALEADAGIHIRWPGAPSEPGSRPHSETPFSPDKAEERYLKRILELETVFDDARAYMNAKEATDKPIPIDLRWEALIPVIKGQLPVYVNANKYREIMDAIQWSKDEGLDMTLIAGGDAWRAADAIEEADIGVIVNQVNSLPRRRWESYDTFFTNVLKLHQSGIRFAIAFGGGGPLSSNERNLPYEAAKAVGHGLPKSEALKAITLYPARLLGVDDRIGSLEEGKHATLIITDGDPLDIRTQVSGAFIQGRKVNLSSRHTQLYEKYQKKYE